MGPEQPDPPCQATTWGPNDPNPNPDPPCQPISQAGGPERPRPTAATRMAPKDPALLARKPDRRARCVKWGPKGPGFLWETAKPGGRLSTGIGLVKTRWFTGATRFPIVTLTRNQKGVRA
jgi:hypothetical protein